MTAKYKELSKIKRKRFSKLRQRKPRKTAKKEQKSRRKSTGVKDKIKKNPNIDYLFIMMELFDDEGITDTEKKVLAVKAMPESLNWTSKYKAELVGITPQHWNRLERSPGVIDVAKSYALPLPNVKVIEVINRLSKDALGLRSSEHRIKAQALLLKYSELGMAESKAGAARQTNLNLEDIKKIRREKLKNGLEKFGLTISIDN